jgi:hypothetical protein
MLFELIIISLTIKTEITEQKRIVFKSDYMSRLRWVVKEQSACFYSVRGLDTEMLEKKGERYAPLFYAILPDLKADRKYDIVGPGIADPQGIAAGLAHVACFYGIVGNIF